MEFQQFYLGCLAHASYLIASNGEAVVVDPQRDVQQYLDAAASKGWRIRYVIETHLHADFVSGHRELADRTGAEIVFGAAAGVTFPHRAVVDGDTLRIGDVELEAIETPGHTPESISWLVTDDTPGVPAKVLTGDTLFIGDVGRPDLAGSRGYTAAQMAALLHTSLHEKLLALPDEVEVWPAHGAGSSCGRNIGTERSSTIGQQRRTNYALQPMTQEAFVAMMTTDLPPAPPYFTVDAEINRRGAPVLPGSATSLTPDEVERALAAGAVGVDVRDSSSFGNGHVPGTLNLSLRGQFASWAGTLVDHHHPIVLIATNAAEADEAVMRLARVGLDHVAGVLLDGVTGWAASGRPVAVLPQWNAGELDAGRSTLTDLQVLDVRRRGEFDSGHVPGAMNIPLDTLASQLDLVDPSRPLAVICASGYRSSAAASLVQQLTGVVPWNVVGGTAGWIAAGYETEGATV